MKKLTNAKGNLTDLKMGNLTDLLVPGNLTDLKGNLTYL